MAYRKSHYRNGTTRGGTSPKATDTAFGAPGNKRKTPRRFREANR